MTENEVLIPLPVAAWHGPFDAETREQAVDALESGHVLVLPALAFLVAETEHDLLRPSTLGGRRKNISLDPEGKSVSNTALDATGNARLTAMLDRFATGATTLIRDLLPCYADRLERARASFRPAEIEGRSYSLRHDDRLLHVDAYPSRPMRGRRILRVFSNVAPDGATREWLLGERFEEFARQFCPRLRAPLPGSALVQSLFGLTKGQRAAYDHIMLGLHDAVKRDSAYQAQCPKVSASFPSGTTWICFTDQMLHAALSGHCALEQTFHLPVASMHDPELSPLRVLERLTGQNLA